MNLTAKRIERLRKRPGRYGDGHGLYLQVISPTNASWVLRYQRDKHERMMGLGPLHTLSLREARERATQARLQLLDGVDPLAAKAADKAARAVAAAQTITFAEAASQYVDQHKRKWQNEKHTKQFSQTLMTYAYPVIGRLPVADIDTAALLRVLEQKHKDHPEQRLWDAIPETANRVRSRIEAVLSWCTVRGYRKGRANPAQWRSHLSEVLPAREKIRKTAHHPALPYSEISQFMTELRAREGVAARALEFTILTAARTGETVGARWDEIDLRAKVWTIPSDRMKGGREHKVPLADAAIAILKNLPTETNNPHVFVGARAGAALSNMAMFTLLRRLDRKDITVHGFRSSFRDWSAEQTNFPREICEAALAHQTGSAVELAYLRSSFFERRRQLMMQWARYCYASPMVKGDKVVVPLRGRR